MHCAHFAAGRCRSCHLLEVRRPDQVAAKEDHCRRLLGGRVAWLPPVVGPEAGFRNKAKMVVSGPVDDPVLGILGPGGTGVDLRDCPLHTPGIQAALPVLADFVREAGMAPYDVAAQRGELKHVLVTESPDGELMVRFVLRSQEAVARIRKHLPGLRARVPAIRVVSVNLQPEHKAVLEGEREILLSEETSLPMRLGEPGEPGEPGEIVLHLRPKSFFQTNTGVARTLYRTARAWVDELAPQRVLDLYCGVGGFALHLAAPGREVTGVEISAEAVTSARLSAAGAGLDARFETGDATTLGATALTGEAPDLVVVNPPRRGIGPELATRLEESAVEHVLYSSCRAETLARDLADMPSLRPRRAVLLDMFPHTSHYEVLVLLSRTA